jgi:hypothetical protein
LVFSTLKNKTTDRPCTPDPAHLPAACCRRRELEGRALDMGIDPDTVEAAVRKTPLYAPFYTRNDHFAKTGWGQTWGKHSKKRERCVLSQVESETPKAELIALIIAEATKAAAAAAEESARLAAEARAAAEARLAEEAAANAAAEEADGYDWVAKDRLRLQRQSAERRRALQEAHTNARARWAARQQVEGHDRALTSAQEAEARAAAAVGADKTISSSSSREWVRASGLQQELVAALCATASAASRTDGVEAVAAKLIAALRGQPLPSDKTIKDDDDDDDDEHEEEEGGGVGVGVGVAEVEALLGPMLATALAQLSRRQRQRQQQSATAEEAPGQLLATELEGLVAQLQQA